MIVKIVARHKHNADYTRSAVKSVHKELMEYVHGEPLSEFVEDYSLIDLRESSSVWRLTLHDDNGGCYTMAAPIMGVFLMNDNGKTIDRF